MTKQPLALDDLLEIKTNPATRPRPASNASIPGLLQTFHDEWDALMLETHELRKDLHGTRQELSHALYQHDAACRVIARLVKERDDARAALAAGGGIGATAQAATHKRPAAEAGEDASGEDASEDASKKRAKGGIPDAAIAAMTETSKALSKARKKREISASHADASKIEGYACAVTAPLHATKCKGILAVAPGVAESDSDVVLTAGADGSVGAFSVAAGKKRMPPIAAHKKRCASVAWCGAGRFITGSADKTVKVYAFDSDDSTFEPIATLGGTHEGEVVSVSPHPTNTYAASLGADGAWAFHDVGSRAETLSVTRDAEAKDAGGYSAGGFHPDGLILASARRDGVVSVWDVKSCRAVAKMEGHAGAVTGLAFSENGYVLATCDAEFGAKMWDLRKLKNFRDVPMKDARALAFDHSGHYLGICAGSEVSVFHAKAEYATVKTWKTPKPAQSCVFGRDAEKIFAGCADHNLRVYQ